MSELEPAVGILGGSGIYALDGFESVEERTVRTPFGPPSDALVTGRFAGRRVVFLPRHGKGHRIAANEVNHRANLYALRQAGVRWLVSVCAVGSLKEDIHPCDVVLVDQFFDRTSRRDQHTFFGNGIVAHVGFSHPVSENLRVLLRAACDETGCRRHDGGVYVNMDGPAFSTRAESETNRRLGFDVIGMTNVPEAKLAREAGIALATLAMVTDYDCWKTDAEPVTAGAILEHLKTNVRTAKAVLEKAIPKIPQQPDWPEHSALKDAIITPREYWPRETTENLGILLEGLVP